MRFVAFVDPAGGSGKDSFTVAVAHRDRAGTAVLDAVGERRPPFSPEAVVQEFAALLHTYGVSKVTGDRDAGEWPREAFRKHGISYQPSDRTKSEIYTAFLPLLNSGRVRLLDNPKLLGQLAALERRTSRAGRDSIDHPPGANAHDDLANAAAGACVLAMGKRGAGTRPVFMDPGAPLPPHLVERVAAQSAQRQRGAAPSRGALAGRQHPDGTVEIMDKLFERSVRSTLRKGNFRNR